MGGGLQTSSGDSHAPPGPELRAQQADGERRKQVTEASAGVRSPGRSLAHIPGWARMQSVGAPWVGSSVETT